LNMRCGSTADHADTDNPDPIPQSNQNGNEMNFCSDNVAGVAPEIMQALVNANAGTQASYGHDIFTAKVEAQLSEIFECRVVSFPVITGTSANVLGLSAMTPPYGAVYCHDKAHISVDECGAPEFYTGAKLVEIPGASGKLSASELKLCLKRARAGDVHHTQPAVVSLSQATECGTVYSVSEIGAIAEIARSHKMKLHMDGARFANALAHLHCTPAESSWKAGVDVMALGATKNGAMAAEVIIFFDTELAENFGFRRKRAGHLVSKMRFASAQLEAYFANGLWIKLASHANAMATRLSLGLNCVGGVHLQHATEANEIFVQLPSSMIAGLRRAGFAFFDWPDSESSTIRLVTAFNTDPAHVERFLATARRLADDCHA
jgi:threonine aldolase